MSLRPVSLAAFFPAEEETQGGSQTSGAEKEARAGARNHAHRQRQSTSDASLAFKSSEHAAQASTSAFVSRQSEESWDNTEPYGYENACWEDEDDAAYDNEAFNNHDEHNKTGTSQAPWHVWLSDEEKLRVAFRRAQECAAKVELDRSPFFPRTTAEYVGLRADRLEAQIARLKAKVAERENKLRAQINTRAKVLMVVGASGQLEEKIIPVFYEGLEESTSIAGRSSLSPLAQPFTSATNAETLYSHSRDAETTQGNASNPHLSNSGYVAGQAPIINTFDSWQQASYPLTTGATAGYINTAANWAQPAFFPGPATIFNTSVPWCVPVFSAGPVTGPWAPLNAPNLAPWEANYFPGQPTDTWLGGPSVNEAGLDPQANGNFSYQQDSTLPARGAAEHERGRFATILWEIAAHAAIRRGRITEGINNGNSKDGYTRTDNEWMEEEAYDSDDSFTPSDYRPKRNTARAWGGGGPSTWSFIPTHFRDRPEEHEAGGLAASGGVFTTATTCSTAPAAEGDDKGNSNGNGKLEGDLAAEDTASNSGASSSTSSDYTLDTPKLYPTLDGTLEPKGKGKVPPSPSPSPSHTPANEAANPPSPAPSSISTFTPSDYDPRKLKLKESNPPVPIPPQVPVLATLHLTHHGNLSPFFAHASNPFTPSTAPPECPWPTYAEYTSEGDQRIHHYHPNRDGHADPFNMTSTDSYSAGGVGTGIGITMGQGMARRFLPVPRLAGRADPRLVGDREVVEGYIPWEKRMMAGERWDLHGERRIYEVWARGGRVRFEDEEVGWDWLEDGQGVGVGVGMAKELVRGF